MTVLHGDKVLVFERKQRDQLANKGYGERKPGELVLDLFEAIYLAEKEKLVVADRQGNALPREELMKAGEKKNKRFYPVYLVFADFRDRGFVVKTGFKFGFDLRVYPRGKKPGEAHSAYVVSVATQNEKFTMPELSRMVRMAGTLKTQLLQAVVDNEDAINYYVLGRMTP